MGIVLTHAEDIRAQHKCVTLSQERLNATESMFHDTWTSAFVKHREVIKLFGRFPHRNKWLGRHSMPDEEAFLTNPKYRFDAKMEFDVDADGNVDVSLVDMFGGRQPPPRPGEHICPHLA